MSNFTLSEKSKSNMAGIDSRLIRVVEYAITITKIDFGIPQNGGIRTAEQQNLLFKQGASKCDGYDKKSEHQNGKAVDFYAFVNGVASWEKSHLTMVACALLQSAAHLGVKISWGGLWNNFVDMPHIQLEE